MSRAAGPVRAGIRLIDNLAIGWKLFIAPLIGILAVGVILMTTLNGMRDNQATQARVRWLRDAWIDPLAQIQSLATRLQASMFRLTSFGLMGADPKILGAIAASIQQEDARLARLLRNLPDRSDMRLGRAALMDTYQQYRRMSTNAVTDLLRNPGWGATTARNAAVNLDNLIGVTDKLQEASRLDIKQEIERRDALQVRDEFQLILVIASGSVLVTLVNVMIGWRITVPLRSLTLAMARLAVRDYDCVIPAETQTDEVGSMARAVRIFRDGMIKADGIAAEERATRNFLTTVLENLPVPVIVTDDRTRQMVLMNPAAERLLRLKREAYIGKTREQGWPPVLHTISDAVRAASAACAGMMVTAPDIVLFAGTGEERLTNIARLTVAGPDDAPHYNIKLIEDVTERRQAERRLSHMAQYDALTQLPNRVLFADRLGAALLQAGADGSRIGILAIDLDHFKEVNDTLGHAAGDALLCTVSERLLRCLRDGDTLARLGGDEFAVIQCHVKSESDVEALASRLLDCVRDPVEIDGQKVFVGLSIGIALSQKSVSAPELLQQADLALYDAKQAGRLCFRVFMPVLSARAQERRTMEQSLRTALDNGELQLAFQPAVSLTSGDITGCEALMRWTLPGRGAVPPSMFIPLAEETGLIRTLGHWLLREACREAASWLVPIRIAVNVSPVQIRLPGFVDQVRGALTEAGLDAARLEIEITEGVLMRDTAETLNILREIRALGVRIVLDDFGTGFSSLAYLLSFTFDKLKIDRSFVSNLETDPAALAIMRAVLLLADSLRMISTAEGVEVEAQAKRLQSLGCQEAQGFFFWRPMTANALRHLLASKAAEKLRGTLCSAS
jgi:diguanylate cyclase (GGDEF)-like protein/PAS domain S-box-containing protein